MNPYQDALQYSVQKETNAQKKIRGTLLAMMEETPLNQIEVKGLCSRAHIARSTFYLYYRNINDVLCEMENELVQDLTGISSRAQESPTQVYAASAPSEQGQDSQALVSQIWTSLSKHRRLIQIQILERDDHDFMKKLDLSLKYLLWEYLFEDNGTPSPDTQFVVPMISVSILRGWVHEQNSVTSDAEEASSACKEIVFVLLEEAKNRIHRNTRSCRVLKTGVPAAQ